MKLFVFILALCIGGSTLAQSKKLVFQEPKMGSMFTIQVWADDSLKASMAARQAFAVADSLNLIFSDYLPDSELNQLNETAGSGQAVSVSPHLWAILEVSKTAWARSKHTFDITVGQLTQLWRKSRKSKELPDKNTLQTALATVGGQYMILNDSDHRVQLQKKGTRLDLGGIGKGYAAQQMLKKMQEAGFEYTLCDAAGNMAIGKHLQQGWKIGVEWPDRKGEIMEKLLPLSQTAISTSGDAYQSVEINGVSYSHIVSPKTGLGVTYHRQTTIVTEDAGRADWLSTACYLLPIQEALRLAESEHAELLILEKEGNYLRTYSTAGFKKWFSEE
ncbi:MAG: FAD:protein FMN transferase [Siphonobacter sp.]